MISWADLTEAHLDAITPHPIQMHEWINPKETLNSTAAKALLMDGRVMVIAGIYPVAQRRHCLWVMFDAAYDNSLTRHLIRGTSVFFEGLPEGRIECDLKVSNVKMQKILKLMGFALEGRLRYYYPTGDDAFMFSFIKRT